MFTRRKCLSFVKRWYNAVTNQDILYFKQIIGATNVKTEDIDGYNEDWLRMHKGQSPAVLLPRTNSDVSEILKHCSSRMLPIVVQGGKTSLVAGSVPTHDEIIVSMSGLNKIESFNKTTGVIICESGCILQNLEEHVSQNGYKMPYDLGAKGSCQIGGNVATNAAGIHFVKYGSLHGRVLGLEVVTADGQILNLMSTMRKDNTGYDLKQIFIGSEGTLGIITKIALLCAPKPASTMVAMVGLNHFSDYDKLIYTVRSQMEDSVSALEMMDEASMDLVTKNCSLQKPFSANFYGLLEFSSNHPDFTEGQLSVLLEKLLSDSTIVDGTCSAEPSVINKLWALRERIPEALLKDGYCYKYDVSLPFEYYYELVHEMRRRLGETSALCVCGYGHIGDLNLHFNVTSRAFEDNILSKLEPFVYEWVSKHNGSISAEHGIGLRKKEFLHLSKSAEAIELMRKIKHLLDPQNILNPGKLFH